MSNAAEFADWKKHPITELVFDVLREQEQRKVHELSVVAGTHPPSDRYLAGYIAALRDVFLMDVEDIKND